MSDKSFGDHTNRNVVKNPLLSTAVTGLSLEDLTHNAVLLPVALSQELITRQDQQSGFQNITLPPSDTGLPPQPAHPPLPPQNADRTEPSPARAQPKTEDDFDVNEYFARLQGTRYVSAPLNSSLKDPQPAEDNLEEINLNEPEAIQEVQQSITADIAQNFSQLPTVLPQVASAVFNSFSNMLNYKSREVTPDDGPVVGDARPVMQDQFQRPEEVGVPLMGVDEPVVPKELAPPPKEPPVGGTISFRITTKKKAYAQIPGLSSQLPPPNIQDPTQSIRSPTDAPPFFTPSDITNTPINMPPQAEAKHDNIEEKPNIQAPPPTEYNIFNPIETHKDENIQRPANVEPTFYAVNPNESNKIPELIPPQGYQQDTPNVPANVMQSGAPIIPPPPMFSNLPRRDSAPGVGKSVLPPSVARRICAHQPIIKPHMMHAPMFPAANIFMPGSVPENTPSPNVQTEATMGTSKSESSLAQDPPPVPNLPSAFVHFKSTYSNIASMNNPYNEMTVSDAHDKTYSHSRGPIFPPTSGRLPSPPAASMRMPTPNQADRMPSPNAMPHTPPSFFNPGNLSSSLSAVNATRRISVESAVASNTAKLAAGPQQFFGHGHHPLHHMPPPRERMHPPLPTGAPPENLFNPELVQDTTAPPAPTFFNPNTVQAIPDVSKAESTIPQPQNIMGHYFEHNAPTAESTKPVPEPPKMTGSLNYRLQKKRPQYYSGPIEGIGAISNNVKPVIPDVETRDFQGALFMPEQAHPHAVPEQSSSPFDISKPAELTSSYTPFAINSQINNQAQSYVQPDYDTAFDMSRQTTDNYNPPSYDLPKEETRGFGIIGSLKSKLSSIDINKIQNSVTTFFDPAYNDTSKEATDSQGNAPYDYNQGNVGFGTANQESNLEIFVPSVDQNASYNQSFNSQNQYQNIYSFPQGHRHNSTSSFYDYVSGYGHYNRRPSQHHHLPHAFHNIHPPRPDDLVQHGLPQDIGPEIQPQADVPADIPAARQAFEEAQPPAQEANLKINPDGFLEKPEKKITSLTDSATFKDNNFNTYNLFGTTANITPADVENNEKTGSLDDASALSFFDDQSYKSLQTAKTDSLINKIDILDTTNNNRKEIIDAKEIMLGKNFDDALDFSVDILQPNVCGMKSSSILFGPLTCDNKSVDFVQNPFGCAFIKHDSVEDISKDLEQVVDKTIGLVLNEDVQDDVPNIDVSSVPLYGLSTILAEKTKEITNLEDSMQNITLQEDSKNSKDRLDSDISANLHETLNTTAQPLTDEENEGISELNICETCREIDKPEDDNVDDLTVKLIENITSPIQLSNPVAATLTETEVEERTEFNNKQCEEISHITEETIETIQVQSATDLLDEFDIEDNNGNTASTTYGWAPQENCFLNTEGIVDHTYTFQIDPNSIGFFGNNPMFFDNIPTNASDEIKAEFKSSQEDAPAVLPRQMSVPTAPPAEEDDSKSDETGGLDVNSIEQDAKKDFPLYEEFVIEPSETDDDKIEYRERERSSEDPVQEVDSFTNRVEKFKKMEETVEKNDDVFEAQNPVLELKSATSPAITIASYFDTGNYAVESHYRNSLTSPSSIPYSVTQPEAPVCVPPGFEDEYKRRLSNVAAQEVATKDSDIDINVPPTIPDTSTQTPVVTTTTYSTISSFSSAVTVSSSLEMKREEMASSEKLPDFSTVFGRNYESGDSLTSSLFGKIEQKIESTATLFNAPEAEKIEQKPLPDPISFFSGGSDTVNAETPDTGFNRLASYFQTPAKTDHGKSFFELSQSQNHYRHASSTIDANSNQFAPNSKYDQNKNPNLNNPFPNIPQDVYVANLQLMKDLTSIQNFTPPKDQVVRTVNYFTVEYNDDEIKTTLKNDLKTPDDAPKDSNPKKLEVNNEVENDDEFVMNIIKKCEFCCSVHCKKVVTLNKVELDSVDFKFKKAMDNDGSGCNKDSGGTGMEERRDEKRKEVAVTFDSLDEENEAVAMVTENRTTAEYSPVKHHWFYRVDFEGKSIWRGFSATDNKALEDAFHSPNLSEETLVATDGGRFDVNVVGRLRIAVYWTAKPTNVRRCSWFYKGATDARYVPYTEPVAEKLEEEYRHGVTTGEWHRRLVLPNNESVVMHGPTVMVHFPQAATDAFSTTPIFAFGKRVYRNPPKIRVCGDQSALVDHLVLLVHGAGEYRGQRERERIQSTMRPRVVRRGCDETEIEDPEPSSIDHLLLLCHGVGSACDMRFRSVEEVVDDFRTTSLQLLQSHYRNSYDKGVVNRVEVLPISWHATLHSGETGVDKRLSAITLDSIPKLRNFTNDTVLDVLFYTSPVFCQTIIDTVCAELNRIYALFARRNPRFAGRVSLGGHSLGSVILYDLLCHQPEGQSSPSEGSTRKSFVSGGAGAGQGGVAYPPLQFRPAALYALGSPIAMFECIRGVKSLGADFALPTCSSFFNIFHPYDPIAYRIEPLINSALGNVKPSLIPHHKGRKRMHLELKDTMARVGADLKAKLLESLKATWSSMWKTPPPPNDGQLEKVVEEEMEKEQLCEESKEDDAQNNDADTAVSAGRLNGGRRVDYVLQEAPFEMINEYLFAMSSHVCYWESEDTMLLILREIYDALGVPPDCCVPQRNLSVQRARPAQDENETIVLNATGTEHPSTSRGGT